MKQLKISPPKRIQSIQKDAILITPVRDSYFPEIAPRPSDTSFDTSIIETELGVKPVGVKDGLVRMRSERICGP